MLDQNGQPSLLIRRQINGYIAEDPASRPQKCLPPVVFKKLYNNRYNELSTAIGQLTVGALFFGMRSCEYSKVSGDRKTQIIKLKHVRFFNGNREIKKSAIMDEKEITSVTITFLKQKNGDKEADRTMHRTNNELCPVKAWSAIASRIMKYPSTNENTPVNYIHLNNRANFVDSKQVLQLIRLQVALLGKDILGFSPEDVGTHSIRSSFAMLLHLAGKDPLIIMLQGRWRSQAFMDYIRPQVVEFSTGLSSDMIQAGDFYHIPEALDENIIAQEMKDPCVSSMNASLRAVLSPQDGLQYDRESAQHATTSHTFCPHWI